MPDRGQDRYQIRRRAGYPPFQPTGATVIASAAAAVLTLLVYLPTLSNGFVNWDDQVYIYSNEMIRTMDAGFFRWAFTSVVSGNWHPLTLISHAVDYRLWGLDPRGHHLTGVVIHAVNTALVCVITTRLVSIVRGDAPRYAVATGLAAAILFGAHPLHVESVAWASERKDLLSALFFLLSVAAYLGYAVRANSRRWWFYAASLVSMALSLLSKPMAVTLPVVLLIIDSYPLERFSGERTGAPGGQLLRALVEKVPFFVLSAAFSAVTIWAQALGGALRDVDSIGLGARIITAVKGFSFYLWKMALPLDLAPYYPYPEQVSAWTPAFIGALVVFAALTGASVYLAGRGRGRYLAAAWAYYVVTLLPVSGVVQVGAMAAADRYFYLPGIAGFLLAGLLFARVVEYGQNPGARGAAVASVLVLLAVTAGLSAKTISQVGIWKDSITLWTHEIELYPDSVPLAYANRGIAYGRAGRVTEALADLNRAVEIRPGFSKGYFNRSTALSILGRRDEAIADLTTAISIDPGYRLAYMKRAELLAEAGRYAEAIADLKALVGLEPGYVQGYRRIARLYSLLGDREEARRYSEIAVEVESGRR